MCSDLAVAVLRRPQGGGVALVSASSCTIWRSSADILLGWCPGDPPIDVYLAVPVRQRSQGVRIVMVYRRGCVIWCAVAGTLWGRCSDDSQMCSDLAIAVGRCLRVTDSPWYLRNVVWNDVLIPVCC